MKTPVIDHISLFPTIIGSATNIELANEALPAVQRVLSENDNINAEWKLYKSTYGKNINVTVPILKDLNKFVIHSFEQYTKFLGVNNFSVDGLSFFYSSITEKEFHPIHSHINCSFSGVYYLKVPQNSSKIRFWHPNYESFDFSKHNIDITSQKLWNYYDLSPFSGQLLMWPSWVKHEVIPSTTSEERITAVFNITNRNGPTTILNSKDIYDI
jgi:uncharacterized protein (TIGR02466 family)